MAAQPFDFTQGSIPRKMALFAFPIFFGNMLQASYQFIDSLWVGNLLGADALGSVSLSATVIFSMLSFIIGINSATLTILSQQKGKNDWAGLKESLNAFVVILGLLTIVIGIAGYFASESILRFLRTPADILPLASTYLRIHFLGIPFLFGYNFIGTVLRALGDSRTPVRFVMLAVILNAALDPLMIAGFKLGIAGAAYATVLSQAIAFIYGVVYSLWKGKIPFSLPHRPKRQYAQAVLRLGLPSGFQMFVVSSGMMGIMSVVASFGKDVVAGFGAAQRMENLIMLPAYTLGSAVNSMSGQNIGAGLWNRVPLITRSALIIILSVSFGIGLIVFLAADTLIGLFLDEPGPAAFGAEYLRAVAFFYPFIGVNLVLGGIIRSSGAVIAVLILNVVSFWLLRYPLAAFASLWFGKEGIGYGIGISFIFSGIVTFIYYRMGRWKKAKALGR